MKFYFQATSKVVLMAVLLIADICLYSQIKDSVENISGAIVKFNEGNYNAAEIEFRKFTENGKNPEACFYLGEIYLIQKEFRKAMEFYNLAIEGDSSNSRAYKGRGKLKAQMEDFHGSVEDFNSAIKYNPKYADAYFNRGLSHYNLKDYNAAITDFSKVISINGKDYQAYVQRGMAKYQVSDTKGACKDWSKAGELGYFEIYETIKKNCK